MMSPIAGDVKNTRDECSAGVGSFEVIEAGCGDLNLSIVVQQLLL